ncbi:MAG: phosphatidate cytidylyltransferase [Steroidobacteraceae bacterium]
MLRQRVITALILGAVVLLGIFTLPQQAITAVIAALILAGAWEWSAFVGLVDTSKRLVFLLLIACGIGALWWIGPESARFDNVPVGAACWWLLALVWIVFMPTVVNAGSTALAGVMVLLPAWLALVRLHAMSPQLLLFVLLLVVAADVGAYFAGRQFGSHKLAPRVSPGKTWEGVGGGLAGAMVLAVIGVYWFNLSPAPFIGLCAVVFVASVVGDLTESMFKRHAGVKDSGSLLPGHGGVLDRIDSITAAAPIFLLGLERLGLWR